MSDDEFEVIESALQPLCVTVNQSGSRLGIGHRHGFTIFDLKDPTQPALIAFKKSEFGGVGCLALLLQTYYVAVVGGGPQPLTAPHKLLLFSGEHQVATTTLSDTIRTVELTTNMAISLTQTKFFLTSFKGEKLLELPANGGILPSTPTFPLALSLINNICAFPDVATGHVRIVMTDRTLAGVAIVAHSNPVAALALNCDGSVVASASERGTLMRVWKTTDGTPVAEVRNSNSPSAIRHIGISTSDHIFCISGSLLKIFYVGTEDDKGYLIPNKKEVAKNQSSYFSKLSFLSKYFDSRWACCETELPLAALPTSSSQPSAPATTASSFLGSWSGFGASATASPQLDDTIVCWWDSDLERESAKTNRYRLTLATTERTLLRFEFDSVLGTVVLVSGEKS